MIYPNNPREAYYLADDKAESKKLLEKYVIPVPATFAIIEHSWDIDGTLKKINDLDEFVLKPANGSGGNGILILQRSGDKGWVTPSGKIYNNAMVRMHIASIIYGAFAHDHADKCIVEQKIASHNLFKQIYPEGVPDIRVILYRDKVLMAMLRVPTRISGGKANLHQGAMGIGINLEKGLLTQGVYRNQITTLHPDSGVKFEGMEIPYWKEILSVSHATAKIVPLKYLGVDIIVDQKNGPLVIEINVRPGLQIQNANMTGLLKQLGK